MHWFLRLGNCVFYSHNWMLLAGGARSRKRRIVSTIPAKAKEDQRRLLVGIDGLKSLTGKLTPRRLHTAKEQVNGGAIAEGGSLLIPSLLGPLLLSSPWKASGAPLAHGTGDRRHGQLAAADPLPLLQVRKRTVSSWSGVRNSHSLL